LLTRRCKPLFRAQLATWTTLCPATLATIHYSGGAGDDQLTGGNGADRFRFESGRVFSVADLGVDTITDFTHNVDKIILDKTTFNTISSAAGVGFSVTSEFSRFVGTNASAEVSAADIVYNSTTGDLFFNANGSAGGFGIGGLFATLRGAPTLSANDFLLVESSGTAAASGSAAGASSGDASNSLTTDAGSGVPNVGLLANYMASSFVQPADSGTGSFTSEVPSGSTEPISLLPTQAPHAA
jgi:hypothetical protein